MSAQSTIGRSHHDKIRYIRDPFPLTTKGLRTNQPTHQRISKMGRPTSMTDFGYSILEVVGLLFF